MASSSGSLFTYSKPYEEIRIYVYFYENKKKLHSIIFDKLPFGMCMEKMNLIQCDLNFSFSRKQLIKLINCDYGTQKNNLASYNFGF